MEEGKRIRLFFEDDDILSEPQKSDGLSRSWVLLKPHQHDTVSDVASHLLHAFHLHQSCPCGLILSQGECATCSVAEERILNELFLMAPSMDLKSIKVIGRTAQSGCCRTGALYLLFLRGVFKSPKIKSIPSKISGFVLPPFESTHILKDNEIVSVQKRKVLSIAGNDTANDVEKLKAIEQQPVNSGLLLLANEEFVKEKSGYESDEPEEDDEEDLLEDVENPSGGNADKNSRKRKAADKLQQSKEKKQRSCATGNAPNDVHMDKEKKDDSVAGDSVENNGEPAKSIDKSDVSGSGMKRTDEVHENSKETEDAKIAPKETKKVPSRSARRKYAKRRWLREMAKIQKQNATCESEGLRNWKEDHAKADRKKVDAQVKGRQKWKKHQADAERNVADDRPKGLLHWTPQDNWLVKGKKRKQRSQNDNPPKLPNRNGDAHEQQIHTGDGHEQPTQNGDGLQNPNQKPGDSHEQPGQKSVVVQECKNQSRDASEQLNQESDEENEVIPIVIRPGHIRFEPLGEEQAVQKDHLPQETIQWNGISSKKKGQKWGKESRPFIPRNDYATLNKEHSETLSNEKEKKADEGAGFDKLPPLLGMPKEGDLIAYRVLELSSSWTPELSAYRVGKVSWFNPESNQTMVLPVPEYPIVSKKADEDEAAQLDNSLYKEDGSLEIDFSSLIDVRIFKNEGSKPEDEALRCMNEGSICNVNAPKIALPSNSDKPTVVPSTDGVELNQGNETLSSTAENVAVNIWDQVSEALNTKKEQLSKQNGWGSTPKKVQVSHENSWGMIQSPGSNWGKNTQKAQPLQDYSWGTKASPRSNWGKSTQKTQPPQGNNWGKQSSGSKSWSYKALRGSALGPTMAILRSKKDI